MEIDHEIISKVILHLLLIEDGFMSVASESMYMKNGLPLIQACSGKVWLDVVGTQKNRLNEMVLLGTQNICKN